MTPDAPASPTRRRIAVGAAAVAVLVAGLLTHRYSGGQIGDIAGDALYAVFVYLLLAFLAPRSPRRFLAALALILCAGVEFLQLTDLPGRIAERFPPAALVLGSGFDQRDLLVYAGAVLLVLVLDATLSRRGRRRHAHG